MTWWRDCGLNSSFLISAESNLSSYVLRQVNRLDWDLCYGVEEKAKPSVVPARLSSYFNGSDLMARNKISPWWDGSSWACSQLWSSCFHVHLLLFKLLLPIDEVFETNKAIHNESTVGKNLLKYFLLWNTAKDCLNNL